MDRKKGTLIVVEGLDGSGKSTQIEILKKNFENISREVTQIKLPCYDSNSSALIKMYLGGEFGSDPSDVNAYAASAFYAVDRFASFKTIWKDDYESGKVILADRYATSNAYHQMNKLEKNEWDYFINWLEDFEYEKIGVPKPDLVIYLDMPIDISQKMMSKRYDGDEVKKDVHEANVAYLEKCREAAKFAGEKMGWVFINCAEDGKPRKIDDIAEEIFGKVKEFLYV
ncbi:MAG: deoxynucleoside kinase [Clostridia bacterium]|nr:deoxynucleoside kinase [Clostridia bacterium]